MYRKIALIILSIFMNFSAITFAADWHQLPDGICAKYAAQEFEKIAPQPGVNWLNTNYDWILQANHAGWVTKSMARDAMVGAIAEWQGLNRDGGQYFELISIHWNIFLSILYLLILGIYYRYHSIQHELLFRLFQYGL